MELSARINKHHDELTDADRRLVKELVAAPSEAAFLSANDLASRAGVHEATAGRLAKKLGYSGYPALRAAMQQELRDRIDPASRMRHRLTEVGGEGILASLISDELQLLGQVPDQVSQAELDAAAQIVLSAEAVFLFGYGHATSLVDLAERRLLRAGFRTVRLTGDSRDLAERVLSLSSRDAVLAFALRTEPPALQPLLERASEVGAHRVVISDALGPLLRPVPEVLISASRGSEDRFQSLLVPMIVLDALILSALGMDEERALSHLTEVNDLIERF